MVSSTFTVRSCRGDVDLVCYEWLPEGRPIAVLQFHHGMTSHADYYAPMAEYLARYGIAVYGYDCLGHGRTEGTRGYFADLDGDRILVDDMHAAMTEFMKRFPGLPYFILGHSLGSFILRMFLTRYGGEIDGAVLMSTGTCGPLQTSVRIGLLKFYSLMVGRKHPCRKIQENTFKGNDRYYDTPEGLSPRCMSRDPEALAAMNADQLSDFAFTAGGFIDLLRLMRDCARDREDGKIPRGFPVLLVSGQDDCIGGFGKGVTEVAQNYVRNGQSVEVKLYPDARHDLISDYGHDQVFQDISVWVVSHSGKS